MDDCHCTKRLDSCQEIGDEGTWLLVWAPAASLRPRF